MNRTINGNTIRPNIMGSAPRQDRAYDPYSAQESLISGPGWSEFLKKPRGGSVPNTLPSASVHRNGLIRLNKAASNLFNAERVRIFFNQNTMQIALRRCSKNDQLGFVVSPKDTHGAYQVNAKRLFDEIGIEPELCGGAHQLTLDGDTLIFSLDNMMEGKQT